MLWKEIKTWATSHGYQVDRSKVEDKENSYNYVWSQGTVSGVADSTFNLAKCIYNHITDDMYTKHQSEYENNKTYKHINSEKTY